MRIFMASFQLETTMEDTPKEIVKRLRAAGWSQARIAERVGTSQATICRIESDTDRNSIKVPNYLLTDALRKLDAELTEAGNEQA